MVSERGRLAIKALQIAVVAIALGWLVATTDWARTLGLLSSLTAVAVVSVLLVTGLEFLTRFSMWYAILNATHRTDLGTAARVDLVVKFINHIVPSKASGHSVAPAIVHHFTDHDWAESLSAGVANTGLYATLYGLVALFGLVVFFPRLPVGLSGLLVLSAGLYVVVGGGVLAAGRHLDALSRLVSSLRGRGPPVPVLSRAIATALDGLPSVGDRSTASLRTILSRPDSVALYVVGWAGTLMIIPAVRVFFLLGALGATFRPLWLLPVCLVMAYSVTVLPLSPGGIGIAEASATLVLAALGVPREVAVPVVFLDRFLGAYLPVFVAWYPAARTDISSVLTGRE